eukprot:11447793-Ditylum_brightwellii.AAC.1
MEIAVYSPMMAAHEILGGIGSLRNRAVPLHHELPGELLKDHSGLFTKHPIHQNNKKRKVSVLVKPG